MTSKQPEEILVVDDTPANLKLLCALLSEQGYRVRPAASGTMALRSAAAKAPDLILLDVRMPGVDGYEVCRRLKADHTLSSLPVIFISALSETDDKLRGLAAGGVDYLTKPFNAAEVLARVRVHLDLQQMRRQQQQVQDELARRVDERTAELVAANQAIVQSEERYRFLFATMSQGVVYQDANGRVTDANPAARAILGISSARMCPPDWLPPGWAALAEDGSALAADRHPALLALHSGQTQRAVIGLSPPAAQSTRWLDVYAVPKLLPASSAASEVVSVLDDITERKRSEQALRASEAQLEHAQELAHLGSWRLSDDLQTLQWSEETYRIFGFPAGGPITLERFFAKVHAQDVELVQQAWQAALAGAPYDIEHRILVDGETKWVREKAFLERNELGQATVAHGAVQDITERKQAEARIRAALREKEVLLKEIYHRVKNNLQVVVSLLSLQERQVADPTLRALLAESADRVHAMVLVHEQLYRSEDLASIAFHTYLERLIAHLQAQLVRPNVHIEVHLTAVALGIETAIPCGLILNELLSNACKHAFHGVGDGLLRISMARSGERGVHITVADNGVGIPAGFSPQDGSTLGWQLISALVNQIGGEITVTSGQGTTVELRFEVDNRESRRYAHTLR